MGDAILELAQQYPQVAQAIGLEDTLYPEVTTIPFPDPPKLEAYYGLAGEIVQAMDPYTEADPAATLAQVLIAFGNLVGRHAHFSVGYAKHYMNEYAALVGSTSKGRKGTAWHNVRWLLAQVDEMWANKRIKSGLSSGEGIIWQVHDPLTVFAKGGKEQTIPGVEDKRLLVVETEMGMTLRVLQREGNTLSAILRDAWDGLPLSTLTKSPVTATGEHVSIIGHITRDELRRYVDAVELANGFANRFIFLAVKRSKLLPEGGKVPDGVMYPLMQALRMAVAFAQQTGEMTRSPEAKEVWATVYPQLSEEQGGLLGMVLGRAEAHVTRLSCLYALLDRSAVVQVQHLQAALAVWQYAEDTAAWIFGQTLGDPVADTIYEALQQNPAGLTRTEINRLFDGHRSAGEIAAALGRLAESGKARVQGQAGRGRPAEVWQAVQAGGGGPLVG